MLGLGVLAPAAALAKLRVQPEHFAGWLYRCVPPDAGKDQPQPKAQCGSLAAFPLRISCKPPQSAIASAQQHALPPSNAGIAIGRPLQRNEQGMWPSEQTCMAR